MIQTKNLVSPVAVLEKHVDSSHLRIRTCSTNGLTLLVKKIVFLSDFK